MLRTGGHGSGLGLHLSAAARRGHTSTAAPSPKQLLVRIDSEPVMGRKAEVEYCEEDWVPLEVCFGIPLFDADLNDTILQKVRVWFCADSLCQFL